MMRLKGVGGCATALLLCVSSADAAVAPASVAEAVRRADKTAVRAMLQKHADVNAPEPDGSTALHWAAYTDDTDTAELLIRAGANAKTTNRYGVTPLALASTNGNARMIEALVKAGGDPNIASTEGETPLMLAARAGVPSAVKVLLAHGADVNATEKWKGQTALMWAAAEGHVAAVQALITAGADVQARSKGGLTAFLFAVRESQVGAVRALLASGAKVDDTILGSGPAGRRYDPADSGAAAKAGAAIKGPSALLLAVSNAHFELASLLLDAGADPNFAPQGWTALHELSWVRKPGTGSNSPTPPGSGTINSNELIKRLAAHGANINARASGRRKEVLMTHLNLNGGTPFFFASRTCDTELMRLLVDLGADPRLRNDDDTTPLMAAAGLGTRSTGEDAGTEPECVEAVKLTLELGNDIDAVDDYGNTAMHGAATKQMPSVVKLLAERGARIDIWNEENSMGWTPLRIAAGVYRAQNFRFDVPTTKAIQEVMVAAGVSTKLEAGTTITSALPGK
jgi:ankyrin repeat protein